MARYIACLIRWTITTVLFTLTVIACHLVWTAGVAATGFSRQSQDLPQTTLPLRLVGVIVDPETPSNSACLVQCTFREGKLARLKAGQRACELADVNEIRSDGVLITNLVTSRPELLAFSDAPSATSGEPAPPVPSVTASADTVAVGLAKGSVDYYLGNLADILSAAKATPKYKDGSNGKVVEGFELTEVKQGSIVEQLDLRNGDLLIDVNGQPLDGLPTIIRLLGEIRSTPQVKMTVLRNGQKLTFVLNSK